MTIIIFQFKNQSYIYDREYEKKFRTYRVQGRHRVFG